MPMQPPVLRSGRTKSYDQERRQIKASRRWYGSAGWQAIRTAQLTTQPFCIMCFERDGAMVRATVCDHVVPHREDYKLFWYGKRQSLCAHCHSGDKQRVEMARRE